MNNGSIESGFYRHMT